MDRFEFVQGKKLRCGYTTGSCASAAASAAVTMWLTKEIVPTVHLTTPQGLVLQLEPKDCQIGEESASCAIQKDAGDDPDMTDGVLVYATVWPISSGIVLKAGRGVGTVTRKGLPCKEGEPAINPVPQDMIRRAVQEASQRHGYTGGFTVTISIPGGEEIARKTFNPRLGIVGGLSILGTSGIVEPMSEKALIDTIHTEMNSRRANGERHLLAFFGNYGVDFSNNTLGLDTEKRVTCSNYVGDMLDYAVYAGFEDVLLIGHIGKLIKLSMGIMNTHSRYADGRMEFLALQAMLQGADRKIGKSLYECKTTDEALALLHKTPYFNGVLHAAMEKISFYMNQRVHHELQCEAIIFSNEWGVLAKTVGADRLIALHRRS